MKDLAKLSINQAYLKIVLTLVLLATIGLSTVSHYGITWDEPMEIEMVQWNLKFIQEKKPITEHSRYHGFIFNYFADVVYNTQDHIKQKFFPQSVSQKPQQSHWQAWIVSISEKTKVKHVVTFLFSLFAYFSVAGVVAILAGVEFAWLGALVLALFPRFWGHSFFNPKDIPFATLFILATFAGSCLLDQYFNSSEKKPRIGFNKLTVYSLLYGSLVGLTTGVRIGGFFLLFYLVFAHLLAVFNLAEIYKTIIRFSKFYLIIFLGWAITTIVVYPASWTNPPVWFWKAVNSLAKFSVWNNKVLFNGQEIWGRDLPWYYLPRWITISVPVLFQIIALVGIIWMILKYKNFNKTQRACFILLILQIFCLPLLAIVKGSTMYDEMRHFLFILPGLAALATVSLVWLYQKIFNQYIRLFLVTLLSFYCIAIAIDMISLHPYQYIYFNRTYGGLKAAYQQQETEYWGLSFKEGMEWLNKNAASNAIILVSDPWLSAEAFADSSRHFKMMNRDEFPWGKVPDPDYYMALPRFDYQSSKFFPKCPIVYSVTRQETPLTIIKQCSKS